MLETYPHSRFLSAKTACTPRLFVWPIIAPPLSRRLPLRDALSYIIRPSERTLVRSRDSNGNAPSQVPAGASNTPTMQRARESAYRSLMRYRPRFYNGTIKFVKAETVTDFPDNPAAIWSGLADQFHSRNSARRSFGYSRHAFRESLPRWSPVIFMKLLPNGNCAHFAVESI